MSNSLAIAICQLNSQEVIQDNLDQILSFIDLASKQGAKTLFFPENSIYMRVQFGIEIPKLSLSDGWVKDIQSRVNLHKCKVHLGSVPLMIDGTRFNSSIFFRPGEEPEVTYNKIHLFDITLTGQRPIRESDVFAYGDKPNTLLIDDWLIGQSICYDIRFSELFLHYRRNKVDALLIPAAFLVETGKVHWETLIKARAIESQCYVIAAAQAGTHISQDGNSKRTTFGNSMIVSPWGEVLAQITENKPDFRVVELKKSEIEKVRTQIPMSQHIRL